MVEEQREEVDVIADQADRARQNTERAVSELQKALSKFKNIGSKTFGFLLFLILVLLFALVFIYTKGL